MQRALLVSALFFLLNACSITKHVPQEEVLLYKRKVTVQGNGLKEGEFRKLIRQQPNTSIFGLFHLNLWLYNLSADKNRRWDRWMRSIGEPPVILDSMLTVSSTQRMEEYAAYRGFYGSKVQQKIVSKRRKAKVLYSVQLESPYRVNTITYDIRDTCLIDTSFIVNPTKKLIKTGVIFDGELLKKESERIATDMRNRGYFRFYDSYITYQADTALNTRMVNLTLVLEREALGKNALRRNHRQFYVQKLVLNPNFSTEKALIEQNYFAGWDTIFRHDFHLICRECNTSRGLPFIRPQLFALNNAIKISQLYKEQDINRTYANLAGLRLFKSIDINFEEVSVDTSLMTIKNPRPLVGTIQLSPFLRQGYMWGGEISMSGNGLFGAAVTGSYQHKNLFRGAEILDISLTAAYQRVQLYADSILQNSIEFGGTISLNIPQFLAPLKLKAYKNVVSPRTQISLSGDFQQRPDYVRGMSSFTFGYSWRNLGNMMFIYNPIDINLINVLKITESFQESIKDNPYLQSSYRNTFLLGGSFSTIYNTRNPLLRSRYHVRADIDLKGNMLWAGYKLSNTPHILDTTTNSYYYNTINTRFAQFVKFDLVFTSVHLLNSKNTLASRFLVGIGLPYGNSYSLPFDKMYYSGGANSMRGWQIRTLGPGSHTESVNMLSHLADMRLEANVEYRFKMFWKLEGALFVDAGNIWAIRSDDNREGALFKLSELPQQIAVNWGLGLRLNFNVLIVRADYGIRLHDPTIRDNYFVHPRDWFSSQFNSLFIALGYPF
ncbi:MAG: BamA/TamA family outer membrane protein [Bacteroidales bacterium]